MGLQSATKRRVDRLARVRCVLLLRRDSFAGLAARIDVTTVHLRDVLHGKQNASRGLTERLIAELGVEAWHFVIGATHTLHAEKRG